MPPDNANFSGWHRVSRGRHAALEVFPHNTAGRHPFSFHVVCAEQSCFQIHISQSYPWKYSGGVLPNGFNPYIPCISIPEQAFWKKRHPPWPVAQALSPAGTPGRFQQAATPLFLSLQRSVSSKVRSPAGLREWTSNKDLTLSPCRSGGTSSYIPVFNLDSENRRMFSKHMAKWTTCLWSQSLY